MATQRSKGGGTKGGRGNQGLGENSRGLKKFKWSKSIFPDNDGRIVVETNYYDCGRSKFCEEKLPKRCQFFNIKDVYMAFPPCSC